MGFQRAQMTALGLDFERLEATTPKTLSPPANDPYWRGWERPLKNTEKAALLSHRTAWKSIVDADAPRLILEDDSLLSLGVPEFLAAVDSLTGVDHITLEVRGRKKLVACRFRNSGLPLRRLYQDRTGAAAYILWPSGAAKLLIRSNRRPAIADGVICASYDLVSLQAEPALAIQLDQCTRYGWSAPISVQSAISSTQLPICEYKGVAHRIQRILAQIRMGARRISFLWVAENREIAVSAERPPAILITGG